MAKRKRPEFEFTPTSELKNIYPNDQRVSVCGYVSHQIPVEGKRISSITNEEVFLYKFVLSNNDKGKVAIFGWNENAHRLKSVMKFNQILKFTDLECKDNPLENVGNMNYQLQCKYFTEISISDDIFNENNAIKLTQLEDLKTVKGKVVIEGFLEDEFVRIHVRNNNLCGRITDGNFIVPIEIVSKDKISFKKGDHLEITGYVTTGIISVNVTNPDEIRIKSKKVMEPNELSAGDEILSDD